MGQTTMDWTGVNDPFGGQYGSGSGGAPGSYGNQGNSTGNIWDFLGGQAQAPDNVYFGGSPGAAGAMSQQYRRDAITAGQHKGPQIGDQGTQAIQGQMGQAAGGYGNAQFQNQLAQNAQYDAMTKLGSAAAGYGPSAAQAQLQQGTEQAMSANMAMANSARGQAGIANAQKNALAQNGVQGQQAANQAAQLRAQEMQAAQSAYAGAANQAQSQLAQQQLGYGGLGMQGAQGLQGNALAQAQLQAGQNQLNQQGELAYQQLGFNTHAENMQAQMNNQNNAYALNQANAKAGAGAVGGILGAVGGAMMLSDMRAKDNIREAGPSLDDALNNLHAHQYEYNVPGQPAGTQTGIMAQDLARTDAGSKLVGQHPSGAMGVKIPEATSFALASVAHLNQKINNMQRGGTFGDMQFQEPGGEAAWTIREEPDFLLAKNDRTGELRKLATEPLNAGEKQQAVQRPHGAGPIDGRRVAASDYTFGDGMLGGMMGGGGTPPPSVNQAPMQAATNPSMMNGVAGPQVAGQQAPPSGAPPQQFGAVDMGGSAFGGLGQQMQMAAQRQGAASKLDAAAAGNMQFGGAQ